MKRSLLSSIASQRETQTLKHRLGRAADLGFIKMGTPAPSSVEPLLLCPACMTEMRLLGIEPETETRDLFTFECDECGRLEVRDVVAR